MSIMQRSIFLSGCRSERVSTDACDSSEVKVSAGVSLWASSPTMPLEFPLEKPPTRQH